MRRCPECRRDYYDDSLLYCLDDGSALLEGPGSGAGQSGDAVTAIIDAEIQGRTPTRLEAETAKYSGGDLKEARGPETKVFLVGGVAAAVILIAALGYIAYLYLGSSTPASNQRSLDAIKVERLTGDGKARATAISPDGKFIAFAQIDGDRESLQIKQIETNSTIEAVKPGAFGDIYDVTFSPDGNYLYFNSIAASETMPAIFRVGTLGGTAVRVLNDAFGFRLSPKGDMAAFVRYDDATLEHRIFLSRADGSEVRKLIGASGKNFIDEHIAWSPDGSEIAFINGDDDRLPEPDLSLSVISVSSGQPREIGSKRWAGVEGIVWHGGKNAVYLTASETGGAAYRIWEVDLTSGEATRLTQNRSSYRGLSITADGKSLISREIEVRSGVWVSPTTDPMKAVEVFPPRGDTGSLDWTPDGRIVFISDQSGADEVWIMNADGSNQRQITNDRTPKLGPSVTPDGTNVYFLSATAGNVIFRVPITGGDPVQVTKGLSASNPHVSPDGQWVLYSAWGDGDTGIYRVPTSGGEAQKLVSISSTQPRYSPDGRHFAAVVFEPGERGARTIGIFNLDGGEPVSKIRLPASFDSARGLVWTPDGKAITYLRLIGEQRNLWVIPVEGGEPKRLTDFGSMQVSRRAYSPDGKRIAITRGESLHNVIRITHFN